MPEESHTPRNPLGDALLQVDRYKMIGVTTSEMGFYMGYGVAFHLGIFVTGEKFEHSS